LTTALAAEEEIRQSFKADTRARSFRTGCRRRIDAGYGDSQGEVCQPRGSNRVLRRLVRALEKDKGGDEESQWLIQNQ